MAKITKVIIVNETTLKLEENASIGDEIDLLELNQIDQKIIRQKIDEGKDKIYEAKLDEAKKLFEANVLNKLSDLKNKLEKEYLAKEKEYEIQISKLESNQQSLELSIDEKANIIANEKIKELEKQIIQLTNDNNNLKLINELNTTNLTNQLNNLKNDMQSQIQLSVLGKEKELNETIQEKEREILRLKLDRTTHNIKRIGENLEQWCNNEYEAHALNGFVNCKWYKDNTSVKEEGDTKGTKADFIFKVYASSSMLENELLTSVACEMKSEDPNSVHKKTNASHYNKLDKDRQKKHCEYALLVSELEMDQANDVPIRKVVEYDKMYVVRPQYFIAFLSIIETLGKKYQNLIIEHQIEAAKFNKTEEILETFNKFKDDLLNKVITKIENEISVINDQVKVIDKASEKIKDAAHNIINKHLDALRNKIEKFNITKLNKSIDKLENE